MADSIRILGVDPGLRACGWGVIDAVGDKLVHIDHGIIRPPQDGPLAPRLVALYEALVAVVAAFSPATAAVEETFVNANPASALKLGHARAAALLAPAAAGLSVGEYAPRLVKQAVAGSGAAEKAQVAAMVAVILPGAKAKADAADALAVAICHARHARISARIGPAGGRNR